MREKGKPAEILLVEDDPADVLLTREAFKEVKAPPCNLNVVTDGLQAMAFLRREGKYANAPRPDIILLDLNLPRKDGRDVLADVKADPKLKLIPVVVLTASKAEQDIVKCYSLGANVYVIKPVSLDDFLTAVRDTASYWLTVATLPSGEWRVSA